MDKNTKVSVIIPVFNAEKFVGQAIQSVLDQTFENFELIILDDGSSDGSLEVIQQFKDPRIRLFRHEKNLGEVASRNRGLLEARGDWIAPLDADDVWHRDLLKKKLDISKEYPHSFIGSDIMISFSDKNNQLLAYKTVFEDRVIKSDYLYFPSLSEIVRYNLAFPPLFPGRPIEAHGIQFQDDYYGHSWLYLYFMLYKIGLKHVIVNEPLYYYRYQRASSSLSTSYSSVCSQIVTLNYLECLDWIDLETKHQLMLSRRNLHRKRVLSALRNGLWSKALVHMMQSPLSVFSLVHAYFSWLARWRKFKKLSDSK